jgi:hypothetical protein
MAPTITYTVLILQADSPFGTHDVLTTTSCSDIQGKWTESIDHRNRYKVELPAPTWNLRTTQ